MKKYRFILLPLAVSLMIILTTLLFVLPKIKTIVAVRGKLEKGKEKLSRLTEKVVLLEGLDEYQLGKKVAMVEKALPSKKVVAEILILLSSLAEENGVSFVGFAVSPGAVSPEKFERFTFEASFKGPRDRMESFLRRAKGVLPVMKVLGFEIEEEEATLQIETYVSSLPETLGKIDAPLPPISQGEEQVYQKIAQFESFEEKLLTIPGGKEDPFAGF